MSNPDTIIEERGKIYEMPPRSESYQPALLTSKTFTDGFIPPNYILDGILQRAFLYALTAKTGAGKTAIALRLMAHVALGRALDGRDVEQGRVLMLAGGNADDVRMRWIAMSEHAGFDLGDIPVSFVPHVFSIDASLPQISAQAHEIGGFHLVVVDTSAAYFLGDEDNSNTQQRDHARMLRRLTQITGNPCVLVPCHPVKNPGDDNLVPRGGGAFLNEIDGNLCLKKENSIVELNWQGKFRGPEFAPLSFELASVTSPCLVNAKGRLVPTVIARPLSESESSTKADAAMSDMRRLLCVMASNAGASIADLAQKAGWLGKTGEPQKTRVHGMLSKLKEQKLAVKELDTWRLTPSGERAAERGAK